MKIGIDIDDVITNTSEIIEGYVEKSNNREKLKKHMKEIMKGNPLDPEIINFCMENYIKAFKAVKSKDNASDVINNFFNQGNEIYLITARGENLEFFKGSEEITKEFLEKNNIKYSKIIFNAVDKAQICLDNQIDIMIDDSIEHCEDVRKAGIKSMLFTSNVNKEKHTNVERADSWLDLEKKISLMNK